MKESDPARPRIAVFSGPTATIQNSLPLVTSRKAIEQYGLPAGSRDPAITVFDALRAQRLAAPVTVYIEQFSAHPLESDAAELYAAPDGYIGADGEFRREAASVGDTPVYAVTLRPEDGLYLLPYMARQANGLPWEDDGAYPNAPSKLCRQPFYPDASRLFEEIDRFQLDPSGRAGVLSRQADFDFIRAVPSAGYTKGLPASRRSDVGDGPIDPERVGEDYFPYRPRHLRSEPPRPMLARLANIVQETLNTGQYLGGIWLEGSPYVEETAYWLNLMIDTHGPIVCAAGEIGYPSRHNIQRAVEYICSGVWNAGGSRDVVGVVGLQDDQAITARELVKLDARPGGFAAAGGHGGVVASLGSPGRPALTFRPVRHGTNTSQVRLTVLPEEVTGVVRDGPNGIVAVDVQVREPSGRLLGDAVPRVHIFKHARYLQESSSRDASGAVDVIARMEECLHHPGLTGFVAEGGTPYGDMSGPVEAALRGAALSGIPVVKVGRGNPEGAVPHALVELAIAGGNLTATKARLLLMACLLRFGALPPAADPDAPSEAEVRAIRERLAQYQMVFDTH